MSQIVPPPLTHMLVGHFLHLLQGTIHPWVRVLRTALNCPGLSVPSLPHSEFPLPMRVREVTLLRKRALIFGLQLKESPQTMVLPSGLHSLRFPPPIHRVCSVGVAGTFGADVIGKRTSHPLVLYFPKYPISFQTDSSHPPVQ